MHLCIVSRLQLLEQNTRRFHSLFLNFPITKVLKTTFDTIDNESCHLCIKLSAEYMGFPFLLNSIPCLTSLWHHEFYPVMFYLNSCDRSLKLIKSLLV